jgi:hypothetical protein
MNKEVKNYRTTTRNRQSHEVTKAYMELNALYRLQRTNAFPRENKRYIEHIKEKVAIAKEKALEILVEEQMLAIQETEALQTEEIDEDEIDYAQEAIDEDEIDYAQEAIDVGEEEMINLMKFDYKTTPQTVFI